MRIFAIGDLHLPGGASKPMDVFGSHWENHWERIQADWSARVSEADVVLIPGDISWAMHLEDALEDLRQINALPGRKILLRGNHDYWWESISRVRAATPMMVLQNDSVVVEDTVFCGTRGWTIPGSQGATGEDEKIYAREVMRLKLSLESARKKAKDARMIVLLHYPPFNERQEPSGFTQLLEDFGADEVLYGHLHGASLRNAFHGWLRGVRYHQVSCDRIQFQLYEVPGQGGGLQGDGLRRPTF